MRKLKKFLNKVNKLAFMVTSLSILILLLIFPVAASVNNWEFSPREPVCGDTISIKGNTSPSEKVDVFVTFKKTVPVSAGKFEYILEDVKIPGGLNNRFTVEARGAKNLNVRVKMIIWVTKSSETSGNTVTVSQSSVPPGTYTIKIDGDAKEETSKVDLKITAFQGIEADSKGDFSYSYNTKAVPSGDFEIKVGDIIKKITVQPEENLYKNSDSPSTTSSSAEAESSVKTESFVKTGSSKSENKSSPSPENESLRGPTTSTSPGEKKNSEILTPDKDVEERKIQASSSEKNNQISDPFRLSVDKFYLLIGIGAAVLILIIYSKKK